MELLFSVLYPPDPTNSPTPPQELGNAPTQKSEPVPGRYTYMYSLSAAYLCVSRDVTHSQVNDVGTLIIRGFFPQTALGCFSASFFFSKPLG